METFSCAVPRFRFSRRGLRSDVSVSVVNVAVSTTDGVGHALEFTASPDTPLPVVEGPAHTPLPAGCSVSSLEFNTHSGWVMNNFSGFSLARRNSASYLEVPSNCVTNNLIVMIVVHRSMSYQTKELSCFKVNL